VGQSNKQNTHTFSLRALNSPLTLRLSQLLVPGHLARSTYRSWRLSRPEEHVGPLADKVLLFSKSRAHVALSGPLDLLLVDWTALVDRLLPGRLVLRSRVPIRHKQFIANKFVATSA